MKQLIENITKKSISKIVNLSSNYISNVYLIEFSDENKIVAKSSNHKDCISIEGFMLNFLKLKTTLPVPSVHYCKKNLILMDYLGNNYPLNQKTEVFAADLIAALHNVSSEQYGLKKTTHIGGLAQPNLYCKSWINFFRDQRLIFMSNHAFNEGLLTLETRLRMDTLCDKIDKWIDEPPLPSLIHGDLWAGNVICEQNHLKGFIDPAIYFANPEIELAFSTLFSTFNHTFFDRYKEHRIINPGFFEERRHVYNLYPLLVHLRLFGVKYLTQLEKILTRLGV